MTEKYFHHKLIRDKIPEVITASGGQFETITLNEAEYGEVLKKKLLEEVKELAEASKEELINESADVLELLKSIADYYQIDFKEVEKYQEEKRVKRGGFKKRLFLIWSSNQGGK